jgi:ABC-type glycerol-3-phosphate transport system permease component
MLKSKIKSSFFWVILILILLVTSFPILWMFLSSFKDSSEILSYPPTIFPKTLNISNYIYVITQTMVPKFLFNTILVWVGTILVCLSFALPGAYSLTRYKFKGQTFLANILLCSYMFSPITLTIPLYILLGKMNLINTRLGLILCYGTFGIPFSVWMLWPFLDSLPIEIEEQAMVDGASRFIAFFKILLPNTVPGLIATSIYILILVVDELLYALIFLSSESLKTISVGIMTFIGGEIINWEYIVATGVIVVTIIFIIFLSIEKYLVKGWGVGAVKE